MVNFNYALLADRAAKEINTYRKNYLEDDEGIELAISRIIYETLKKAENSSLLNQDKENLRYFIIYYKSFDGNKSQIGVIGKVSKTYPSLESITKQIEKFQIENHLDGKTNLPTNIVEVNKEDYEKFFSITIKKEDLDLKEKANKIIEKLINKIINLKQTRDNNYCVTPNIKCLGEIECSLCKEIYYKKEKELMLKEFKI